MSIGAVIIGSEGDDRVDVSLGRDVGDERLDLPGRGELLLETAQSPASFTSHAVTCAPSRTSASLRLRSRSRRGARDDRSAARVALYVHYRSCCWIAARSHHAFSRVILPSSISKM